MEPKGALTMSDRFVIQRGGPIHRSLALLITIEEQSPWGVVDTRDGLLVEARPAHATDQGWLDLCRLLNDIYEEGKQSNGKT